MQQDREKRLAQERIKQINMENQRIQNQKNQQRDFYLKYLRQTAEKNIENLRTNPKYHQSQLPKIDAQNSKNTQSLIQQHKQKNARPSRIGGGTSQLAALGAQVMGSNARDLD